MVETKQRLDERVQEQILVLNLPIATQQEAEEGNVTNKVLTPERMKQSILALQDTENQYEQVLEYLSNLSQGDIAGIIENGGVLKVDALSKTEQGQATGEILSIGSINRFSTDAANTVVTTLDTNKICIAWRNSNGGFAVIGTVSGTSVSFGSVYSFVSGTYAYDLAITKINNDKICIAYRILTDHKGYAIVGDITGTSISFGSPVVFQSQRSEDMTICLIDIDKVCITYRNNGNSDYGTCVIGNISGNSISFGSNLVFRSAGCFNIDICTISTNKFFIGFTDNGSSGGGYSYIGTVSGTSISFGSKTSIESGVPTPYLSVSLLRENVVGISYWRDVDTIGGKILICSVSGTALTPITTYIFHPAIQIGRIITKTKITKINDNIFSVFYYIYESTTSLYASKLSTFSFNGSIIDFIDSETILSSTISYLGSTLVDIDKLCCIYRLTPNGDSRIVTFNREQIIVPLTDYSSCIIQETKTAGQTGKVIVRGGKSVSGGLVTINDLGKKVRQDEQSLSLTTGDIIGKVIAEDEFHYLGKNLYS